MRSAGGLARRRWNQATPARKRWLWKPRPMRPAPSFRGDCRSQPARLPDSRLGDGAGGTRQSQAQPLEWHQIHAHHREPGGKVLPASNPGNRHFQLAASRVHRLCAGRHHEPHARAGPRTGHRQGLVRQPQSHRGQGAAHVPPEPTAGPVFKGHSLPRLRGAMVSPAIDPESLRVFGQDWKANSFAFNSSALAEPAKPQHPASTMPGWKAS